MHTLLARRDHGVTGFDVARNLDPARAAHTHLNFHPLGGPGARVFPGAGHQAHHKLALALGNEGLFRHHLRIIALTKNGINPRKHARAQLQLAVVDTPAHRHRAAVGVQQRVNRLHHRHKLAPRQSVYIHRGALAALHLGLEALGQAEVHIQGIKVF